MPDVVICEALRTPIGRFQGGLAEVRPDEWGYANRVVDLIERMAKQDGHDVAFTPHGISNYRKLQKGTRRLDAGTEQ